MAGITDMAAEFRARANEYLKNTEAAVQKFQPDTLAVVAVIVGQVNAEVYKALADVLDYQAAQRAAIRQEVLQEKQKAFADQQNAIRTSAAVGTDDEFSRAINNASPQPVASGAG